MVHNLGDEVRRRNTAHCTEEGREALELIGG
jgi:hypothetical protein